MKSQFSTSPQLLKDAKLLLRQVCLYLSHSLSLSLSLSSLIIVFVLSVRKVREVVSIPLTVGGGVNSVESAQR